MGIISKKFGTSLAIFGLTAFVSLSIFGLWHMGEMAADEEGDMARCIFTGGMMLCTMSVTQHINLWLSMFISAPQENATIFALLVLFIAVIFTTKNILAPPRWSKYNALAYKLYLVQNPDFSLFNPLKEAISAGIINPKIY